MLQSSLLSCIDLGLLIVAVLFPRITVSFNVNNSIPPNVDEPPEGQKDDEVEVKKKKKVPLVGSRVGLSSVDNE